MKTEQTCLKTTKKEPWQWLKVDKKAGNHVGIGQRGKYKTKREIIARAVKMVKTLC